MEEVTKGRRSFPITQLEEVQRLLRELPKKETHTTRQGAMEFLKQDIQGALRKGYTPKELAAYLKEQKRAMPITFIEDAIRQKEAPPAKPQPVDTASKTPPVSERKPVVRPSPTPPLSEKKSVANQSIPRGGFEIIPDWEEL